MTGIGDGLHRPTLLVSGRIAVTLPLGSKHRKRPPVSARQSLATSAVKQLHGFIYLSMAERSQRIFTVTMLYHLIDELRHEVLRLADIRYSHGALQAKHKRLVGLHHELIRMLSLMLRNPDSYPLAVAFDLVAEIQECARELPDFSGTYKADLNALLSEIVALWEEGEINCAGSRASSEPAARQEDRP